MEFKDRVALGMLIGFCWYLSIICAYNLGRINVLRNDSNPMTIYFFKVATGRYKGLYLQQKQEQNVWRDSLIRQNKLLVKMKFEFKNK